LSSSSLEDFCLQAPNGRQGKKKRRKENGSGSGGASLIDRFRYEEGHSGRLKKERGAWQVRTLKSPLLGGTASYGFQSPGRKVGKGGKKRSTNERRPKSHVAFFIFPHLRRFGLQRGGEKRRRFAPAVLPGPTRPRRFSPDRHRPRRKEKKKRRGTPLGDTGRALS